VRWPEALVALSLLAAGLLHLVPASGLFSEARLEALYGVPLRTPELVLMLRHRALLFGLLGLLLLLGAVRREFQTLAIGAALASMGGFLLLALPLAALTPALARVALADGLATLLLLGALALRALFPGHGGSA
jgi:hypothetical protein